MLKQHQGIILALSLFTAQSGIGAGEFIADNGLARACKTEPTVEELREETGWWYRTKEGFFAKLIASGMKSDFEQARKPLPAPQNEDQESMAMTPFGYGLNGLYCAANPPKVEKSFFDKVAGKAVASLLNNFPLATDVRIPSNPNEALDACLPAGHRERLAELGFAEGKPRFPYEIEQNQQDPVAGSALSGSFSQYIQLANVNEIHGFHFCQVGRVYSDEPQYYVVDLLRYNQYPVKEGLDRLGGRAVMSYNAERGFMETLAIQTEDNYEWIGRSEMGSRKWNNAQQRIMGAALTDATFNKHLGEAHLAISATISSITYMLAENHPMRRMLHIHTIGAIGVNRYNVPTLLDGEGAFFGSISSYNLPVITQIMNDHMAKFSFDRVNPLTDLDNRGMNNLTGVQYPYAENAKTIWGMTQGYVRKYVQHYYPNEEVLQKDEALQNWYQDVRKYVPNGNEFQQTLTTASLIDVVTRFIYSDSFDHYMSGIEIINWGSWPKFVPSQVASDGSRIPLGVMSHLINLLCATQPTQLSPSSAVSFSQFGLDDAGRAIMSEYAANLRDYQATQSASGQAFFTAPAGALQTSVYS